MTALTTSEFEYHMDAMARHYRWASRTGGAVTEYKLPQKVLDGVNRTARDSGVLQPWKDLMHSDSGTFSDVHKNGVTGHATRYQQNQNADDFDSGMDAEANQAKQTADGNIDKWKEEGKRLGHEHPDQQSNILTMFKNALGFFTGDVLNAITSFIANAVQTLIEWIKKALEAIGNFFGGIVNSIGNFFGNL